MLNKENITNKQMRSWHRLAEWLARRFVRRDGSTMTGVLTVDELVRVTDPSSPSVPTTGAGLEVSYNAGVVYLLAYDRDTSTFKPIYLWGSGITLNGPVTFVERSSDPSDPAEGQSVMWQSDGTGSGDDGDIMVKITAGGSTKTTTLIDFSTL